MATLPIFVSVQGAQELQALSRRLRDAGRGDLRRRLRSEIRDAGRPVITDLRRAVMGVDVSSTRGGMAPPVRSTNLRRRTARATRLSVTQNGIRIRVRSTMVDRRYPSLPKYLDASLGRFDRWRHPVFGNKKAWTQQTGEPWFFVTIHRHRRDFRRACFNAMERIANEIT